MSTAGYFVLPCDMWDNPDYNQLSISAQRMYLHLFASTTDDTDRACVPLPVLHEQVDDDEDPQAAHDELAAAGWLVIDRDAQLAILPRAQRVDDDGTQVWAVCAHHREHDDDCCSLVPVPQLRQ